MVIPKRLRDRLGIVPGQVLQFDEAEGRLVVSKTGLVTSIATVYGILDLPGSTDAFIDEVRGEALGARAPS